MQIFKNFPKDTKCPLCNQSSNAECALIPTEKLPAGVDYGELASIPVHTKCIETLVYVHLSLRKHESVAT